MPSGHGAILSSVARVPIGNEEWRWAWRRESRLLARVGRAAWRREMAELEHTWAIASAHGEGLSIRKIAAAAGLGPTRVHAIVRAADIDSLDAALGELRSLDGWPAPEDPDGSRDDELAGRELIAERLGDEVEWLRDCAGWREFLAWLAEVTWEANLGASLIGVAEHCRGWRPKLMFWRRMSEAQLAWALLGLARRQPARTRTPGTCCATLGRSSPR